MERVIRSISTPSGPANHEGTGRPLSWHSTSMQQADHYFLPSTAQFQSDVSTSQFLAPTFTTSDFNEAITPMTYPSAGEPFVQGAFTPLEEMSSQDFDDRYAFLNEFSADMDTFYDPQYGSRYAGLTGSDHQYPNGLYQYQKQPEYCLRQLEETAPPTPEVGPLQASTGLIADEPLDAVEQAGAEDLVGMGLYDAPSPLPASMSFLSGSWDIPIRPISGKGLKLEETFEPTTTEDDNDDDNDEIMMKKRPQPRMERRRNPARTKLNVRCYQISGKRTRGPTLSRTCPQISTSLLISQFKGMHGGTRTLLQTMAGCDVAPENGRFLS